MPVYYNEIEPAAAHVLRALIKKGIIANGEVDTRSIADVVPDDLRQFNQCHFFAGGGLWSIAARMAGWADDQQLWTGSCPCQPFSVAGKGAGEDDPRHLWPHFFRLIRSVRPPFVVGEQVAGKAGYGWFDGVQSDLETENYASRAVDVPACAVNAPHIRQRLYWIAKDMVNANSSRCGEYSRPIAVQKKQPCVECASRDASGAVDDAVRGRHRHENEKILAGRDSIVDASRIYGDMADADDAKRRAVGSGRNDYYRQEAERDESNSDAAECNYWHDAEWLTGADGKTRRAKPGVRLLAHGFPGRVGLLRIGGNAIVPQVAAEVLKALMDVL